jgi:hypothetical protein
MDEQTANFKKALKGFMVSGYDPFRHLTPDDLAESVWIELNINPREESELQTPSERAKALKYVKRWRGVTE